MTKDIPLGEVLDAITATNALDGLEVELNGRWVDASFSHEFGIEKVVEFEAEFPTKVYDCSKPRARNITDMKLGDFIDEYLPCDDFKEFFIDEV